MSDSPKKDFRFVDGVRLLWGVLEPQNRRKLIRCTMISSCVTIMEMVSVTSIIPFLGIIAEGDKILSLPWLAPVIRVFPNISAMQLILGAGLTVTLWLILSNCFLFLGNAYMVRTSSDVTHSLNLRLFSFYLSRPLAFHLTHGATLTSTRLEMMNGLATSFIFPSMNIITRGLLCLIIAMTFLYISPLTTIVISIIFCLCYLILYKNVRVKLRKASFEYLEAISHKNKTLVESLRGIKDVIACGYQRFYVKEFDEAGLKIWAHSNQKQKLTIFPRYLLETVAFSGMILFTLSLIVSGIEFKHLIPQLTLFALFGYKLLPAGQNLYMSIISVTGQTAIFQELKNDLESLRNFHFVEDGDVGEKFYSLDFKEVSFTYPTSNRPVLSGVSFSITQSQFVGIAGRSGSGKTTLVELMLGLFEPTDGTIVHGGQIPPAKLLDVSSYVPQSIYVLNSSLQNNITMNDKAVDTERLQKALYVSDLAEVAAQLGQFENLCEDGARLSGGQKQRIGIARAVYRNSPVLILDEATSALDSKTEENVLSRLAAMGRTVIMVTHDIANLERCDKIILLKEGHIEAQGTYLELKRDSTVFKELCN